MNDRYIKVQKKFIESIMPIEQLPQEFSENLEEWLRFRHQLTLESDRGAALYAASYLEFSLEKALRKILVGSKKHLDSLFEYNGPLGTFSNKISMSYSIGLISQPFCKEFHLVRKIRNEFGHSADIIGFDADPIKNLCDSLTLLAREGLKEPRRKFNSVVSLLSGEIDIRCITMEAMNEFKDNPNKIDDIKDGVQKFLDIYRSLEPQKNTDYNDSTKNSASV